MAAKYGILIAKGTVGERRIDTVVVLVSRALAVFRTVHDTCYVDGQFVFYNDTVQLEFPTVGGVATAAAYAEAKLVGVTKASTGQVVVDNSGRRSESEEEGVCPAIDVDALRVIRVEWYVRHEEVPGTVRCGKTANTRGTVRVATSTAHIGFSGAAFVGSRNVAENAGDFGTRSVLEKLFNTRRSEVVHELLGDYLNGGSSILERSAETATGHGLRSIVAFVLRGIYCEGREFEDLFFLVVLRPTRKGGAEKTASYQAGLGYGLITFFIHR